MNKETSISKKSNADTLKTLKDLETNSLIVVVTENNNSKQVMVKAAPSMVLREAAIKWSKELKSADHPNGLAVTEEGFESYNDKDIKAIIFWIKHFFNIKEKDLK